MAAAMPRTIVIMTNGSVMQKIRQVWKLVPILVMSTTTAAEAGTASLFSFLKPKGVLEWSVATGIFMVAAILLSHELPGWGGSKLSVREGLRLE